MIGSNLKRLRDNKGLGVNELSRISGVNASYISAIERGVKNNPSKEIQNKLAEALNVDIKDLIEDQPFFNRYKSIGKFIKEYREKNNLDVKGFAEKCEVDAQFIERLENGLNPYGSSPKSEPTISVLNRISNVIKLSIESLTVETGFYKDYDELMEHQIAMNYLLPFINYLEENDFIPLRGRIASFLEDYGYDYINDNFTFGDAMDFFINEIMDYDYVSILHEAEEMGINHKVDKESGKIIFYEDDFKIPNGGNELIENEDQDFTEEDIFTLAAHKVGHEGALSVDELEKIKLAIKIALAKNNV